MAQHDLLKDNGFFIYHYYLLCFTYYYHNENNVTLPLTVNGICFVRQLKLHKVRLWYFAMLVCIRRHEIQKIDITCLVCESWIKIPKIRFWEIQFLGILTSQNFTGLALLTSEIDPGNFRSIS